MWGWFRGVAGVWPGSRRRFLRHSRASFWRRIVWYPGFGGFTRFYRIDAVVPRSLMHRRCQMRGRFDRFMRNAASALRKSTATCSGSNRRASWTPSGAVGSIAWFQVQMLGEGFDHPPLSVAAIFRPFRSLSPYIQFVGRVMRVVHENKPDHPDNHGYIVSHVGLSNDDHWGRFPRARLRRPATDP